MDELTMTAAEFGGIITPKKARNRCQLKLIFNMSPIEKASQSR